MLTDPPEASRFSDVLRRLLLSTHIIETLFDTARVFSISNGLSVGMGIQLLQVTTAALSRVLKW
jgi:hypothetical protein